MNRRAWWLLLLTVLIPGSAQLVAGSRRLARIGIILTISFWFIFLSLIAVGLINRAWIIWLMTWPVLVWIIYGLLIFCSILFAVITIDTLRLMRLGRVRNPQRIIAFIVTVAVGVGGTWAISFAANFAGVQANFIGSVFNQGGITAPIDGRYNIMLLGADAGANRLGIRPDSISVISIDAATGQTVNIGIPRNLQRVGFSAGSPMKEIYPRGWNCGIDCLINAIYKDVEDNHADAYPDAKKLGSTPGTEATRDAVEYVTGLEIQSYVLVDMASFSDLIDALGGIDINVKSRLPIGGQRSDMSDIKGWIEAGQQHMNGYTALWYARSRHNTSDYDRMRRQHEVEQAILKQIDPVTVLTRFQQIASVGRKLIRTDIPSSMLSQYVELAIKARELGIKEIRLVPPQVDVVYPDFSGIRERVKKAFVSGGVKE